MRPPEFWSGEAEGRDRAPILRAALTPLSWIYAAAGAARIANAKPVRVETPVICIGNVSVGGVGKTPIVRAVRALLEQRGVAAHVLARGHGGRLKGPVAVDPNGHAAADVGDEPLLHARDGPTWIARDRVAGARAAIAAGAQAIVMDDGFQNPGLGKDLSILVVDARDGFGNGAVLPAGPLREPVDAAMARAQATILMGDVDPAPGLVDILQRTGLPLLRAGVDAAPPPAGPLVAFAGIGRPQKFFDTLVAGGAMLVDAIPFDDHHPYTEEDLKLLAGLAADHGASLVTTEKDYVRLPRAARSAILALPIVARFREPATLAALLDPLFAPHS